MTDAGIFDISLIKIDEIVITNAGIDNDTELVFLDKGNHYFDIKYGFTPGININKKKFRIIFSCDINTFNKSDEPIAIKGRFEIAFLFNVENLESLTTFTENEGLVIDPDFVSSLSNIVYSTSRGIIYTRCQGTILKNLILPIISTTDLLKMLDNEKEDQK